MMFDHLLKVNGIILADAKSLFYANEKEKQDANERIIRTVKAMILPVSQSV